MELPQYMFHLLKKEGFLACIIVMPSVYPPGNERIYVVDALLRLCRNGDHAAAFS